MTQMQISSLGTKLKIRREELGLSVKEVADCLRTSVRCIENLEEDRYGEFSAHVYAYGFLKKFLQVLEFPDSAEALSEFETEWNRARGQASIVLKPKKKNMGWAFSFFIRRFLLFAVGSAALAGIFFLFGSKLSGFLQAPRLALESPTDWTELGTSIVHIKGNTTKESQLTVNGREVTINESGTFDQDIELQSGLSTLEFVAENRFGKSTVVKRHIVVQ